MPDPSLASTFENARLHVVTGKGGVGKTTVAASLALALAGSGKRVLIAEVEGRQGISQTFDVPPIGEEVRLVSHPSGGELWGLSVDAKAALMEYLSIFYKLGRAGAALEKVGAVDFATTVAPGVRDVLLIGKVYEAAGRTTGGRRNSHLVYDDVVLDAPPTGRAVRFLNVNAEVADLARVGPIRAQADSITRMLRDRRTLVHMVTLLEEMPVQESVDALPELRRVHLNLGCLVVNQVREPLLTPEQEKELLAPGAVEGTGPLADRTRGALERAGVRVTGPMVRGLLAEGRAHAERVALESEMSAEIDAAGLPVLRLPALADGIEEGGIAVLADEMCRQGVR
ncbi:MAG TPA: ArsA-related P-loop ATPase [Dermatophilaceae bacterium]|nr:ArsA-related P-loop ATPase [Dermatophilaceae bacterium]